ncbi:predicted protein [Aspergillus terreus NIH2624]|uniref:Apple domain-containing protein n=1 Tax=Aspergillus terreus (strain NIH 2624 / FGSC A1156) TaxID=341663 RepID=Q0CRW2_ASPTN|nr:uncharacterized protein ATEG_03572 [Aspergillus terreus NIH2624]EAU36846.1 predicted protein [Aspergillus terreus NIH2624]
MESKNKKTIKDLQAQVTKAQADLGRCRNPPPIHMSSTNCPVNLGTVVTYGGRNWKVYCASAPKGISYWSGYERHTLSQCADKCAQQAQCKYFDWVEWREYCELFKSEAGPTRVGHNWQEYPVTYEKI